ncbi:VOC family protein [Streptomyces specialis]|uniref:VOC family protein n=1 Tax=Streptomyces specialis TaxID=498367 RepID=UPI0018FEBE07|nr:VOC family protein [Streptomyces specialis]
MTAPTSLYGVTLDCADPVAMADFYHRLTGMKITYSTEEFAGLSHEGGLAVNFQRVADYRPPVWPGQDVPQQFHLDFQAGDLAEAEALVLELGGSKAEHQPGDRWRVYLDPAGHPFCLVGGGS